MLNSQHGAVERTRTFTPCGATTSRYGQVVAVQNLRSFANDLDRIRSLQSAPMRNFCPSWDGMHARVVGTDCSLRLRQCFASS